MHDNNGYRTSWKRAKERPAGASIRKHTHGRAHCTLGMLEKDHIQAATLCRRQTQTGSWSSGRKTDMCGVRDEYGAIYGRFVGVCNYMLQHILAHRDTERDEYEAISSRLVGV